MLKEFKQFISRGNVIELAVGVIIGGAFTGIVTSLNEDIITPVLGMFGGVDFSSLSITFRDTKIIDKNMIPFITPKVDDNNTSKMLFCLFNFENIGIKIIFKILYKIIWIIKNKTTSNVILKISLYIPFKLLLIIAILVILSSITSIFKAITKILTNIEK